MEVEQTGEVGGIRTRTKKGRKKTNKKKSKKKKKKEKRKENEIRKVKKKRKKENEENRTEREGGRGGEERGRERNSTFFLRSMEIGSSVFVGARRKVDPHIASYAWVPKSWSFVFNVIGFLRVVTGRMISLKILRLDIGNFLDCFWTVLTEFFGLF